MSYLFPLIIGSIGFFLLNIGDSTKTFLVYKILGIIALYIAFLWGVCIVCGNIGYSIGRG